MSVLTLFVHVFCVQNVFLHLSFVIDSASLHYILSRYSVYSVHVPPLGRTLYLISGGLCKPVIGGGG